MDLTKRELLLEKQLNDLSTSAIPKVEKEPVMPVISTPRPAHDMGMTPDQLDLRDLAYEARLNTIATNSIVQKLGWKPTKIKSDVTKEMVADYLREQTKNVNEKGLYIPANLDMDLEPEFVVGDFEEISRRVDEKKKLIEEAKAIETALMNVPAEFQAIEDREQRFLEDYTRFLMTLEPVIAYQQATGMVPSPDELVENVVPRLDRVERSTLIEFLGGLGQFDMERDRLRDEIELAEQKIAENEFQVDRIDAKVRQLREEQDAGKAEKAIIDQRNSQRKRAYADQIRLLNSGRMIPEQLPGETPEDYKTRLEQVGTTTPDPNSVDAAAKLFYTDVLREKLQEILSDEGDISTFIKDMDGDQRYLVVKNFPEFKKRFQDVMGKDKVRAGGSTMKLLLDLKDNLVGTIAQKKVDEAKKEVEEATDLLSFVPPDTDALASIRAEIDATRGTLTDGQKRNLLAFIDNPDQPEYVQKGVGPQEFKKATYDGFRARIQKVHDSTRVAPAPRRLVRQTTEELKAAKPSPLPPTDQETYRMLRDGILARRDEIGRLDPQEQNAGLQGEDEALRQLLGSKNLRQLEETANFVQIDLQQFARPSGKGVGRKHAEKVAFGRVDIHPNRLFYDNILRISKGGRDLTGFPQKKVSDAFVDVVFTVLKGQTPTLRAFKKMSEEERKLYDTLVFMSGLSKEVEHTGSGVKEDLKKRLQLIEGEIEAGNTNPLLIKEARQVLHHMAQMKMVARPKAVAHLKQLQAFQRS